MIRYDVERHRAQMEELKIALLLLCVPWVAFAELCRRAALRIVHCSCGHARHNGLCKGGGRYLADPFCECVR